MAPSQKLAEIAIVNLDGSCDLLVRRGNFLASSCAVSMHGTARALFSFPNPVLCLQGVGKAAICADLGNVDRISLMPGEQYKIHRDHLVAWESTVSLTSSSTTAKTLLSAWKRLSSLPFLRKDPFVGITGPGSFYIGTRRRRRRTGEDPELNDSSTLTMAMGALFKGGKRAIIRIRSFIKDVRVESNK